MLIHCAVLFQIVSEGFIPSLLFSVTWKNEGAVQEVILGNELFRAYTTSEPDIQITPMGAEEGDPSYTLAMVDPDAPSTNDRKFGPFRHWLVSSCFIFGSHYDFIETIYLLGISRYLI